MSQHETLEFLGWWFLVCMPICLLILWLYGRWYYRQLIDRKKTEVLEFLAIDPCEHCTKLAEKRKIKIERYEER